MLFLLEIALFQYQQKQGAIFQYLIPQTNVSRTQCLGNTEGCSISIVLPKQGQKSDGAFMEIPVLSFF